MYEYNYRNNLDYYNYTNNNYNKPMYTKDENPKSLYDPYNGFIRGNMFPNLYNSYKLSKPLDITPNNEKEALLLFVDSIGFAAHDISLYLDIYSDDKDDNPKITYKVKTQGSIYYLDIEVVDYSNNKVNKFVKLNVKNEKLASNGKWVTYDEVRELRKKFLNIIRKYGQTEEYTYVTSNYWKIQFGSSSTIAVFSDLGWYNGCYYEAIGEEIKVSECNDSAGTIPYEDYKSKIASQEEHAKQAYLNISKEFAKTDYKISDLFLGF